MQHSHGHIQDTEELKIRQSNCWLWLVRSGLYEFPSLLLSSLIPVLKVILVCVIFEGPFGSSLLIITHIP